jgi:hypothetical protein
LTCSTEPLVLPRVDRHSTTAGPPHSGQATVSVAGAVALPVSIPLAVSDRSWMAMASASDVDMSSSGG